MLGLYTDQGVHSCDTVVPGRRVGSLGFEREDARVFAGWGVGYMKVSFLIPFYFFFLSFLGFGGGGGGGGGG